MSSNKVKELLLKLKFSSEVREGAEKENATDKLNKALKKHGLTLEDLEKEEKEPRVFKIKNREDSSVILSQCIRDVCPNGVIRQSAKKLEMYCEMSASEYIEVSEKYKHYYDFWLNEKKQFLTAFVVINKIGLPSSPSCELSDEEKMDIVKKMNTINDNKFVDKKLKQLT